MPPLNYQIGVEVVNKAERTLKQLDKSVKQKFKAMASYQKKFNIQTQLSQQLSRRLLETETMGLSKMQKFYGPVLKDKKGMTKLSDAWHKSESKNLREVNSLMGLNKTEQVKYLKRVGASAEEMKRDTTFTKMNTKSKTELSKIETCRARGLREIGNNVSKTMKMEKEGLVTLSSAQKKQYNDMQRITEGYKRQHTVVGKVKAGMGRLLGTIKKAGMVFLTVLGPLFLVGAAMRTLKQAADWVYQPFIKFEDALYELRKTANLTKKSMLEIGEAISELSIRIPVAAEELAKIAATAGRLGIRGRENILAFTETIAKMSVATVLSADEAAEALARIRQAFAIPVENIEYLGSVINELSNTTASNSRDIVAALGNIGAAGKMLGITADEAAAMSATLVASGMAATRSGTRIRRMLTEMARKSEKMAEAMELSALEMKIAIEKNPMEALLMYLKHLSETESRVDKLTEAHEIFGKVGGFAIATLAENYDELIKNLETARHEMAWGISLQREFQIATTKTSAELQILANRAEMARREMGDNFIPTLLSAKRTGVVLTESLAELSYMITRTREETDASLTPLIANADEYDRLKNEIEKAHYAHTWFFWGQMKLDDELLNNTKITNLNSQAVAQWTTITDQSMVSLEKAYSLSKKWGDLNTEELKPLKTYNDYLMIRDKWINNIVETTEDEIEKDKKIAEVRELNSVLFKKGVKAAIPYLQKKDENIGLTDAEIIALQNLVIWEEREADAKEKGAEATGDATKAIESLMTATEDYSEDLEELTKNTRDLWSGVSGLIGMYDSQYDAYVKLQKMEKGMPKWIKERVDVYDDELFAIRDLIKESEKLREEGETSKAKEKEKEAVMKATNVMRRISSEGIGDMSLKQLDLNDKVLDYFNTWIEKEGIIPSEIKAAEDEFENMIDAFALGITSAFEELPPTEAPIGVDIEYFKSSIAELEPVPLKIKPEFEFGGLKETLGIEGEGQHGIRNVPETGLYKLHKDESVLTKKETQQNIENKNLNIDMGGVSLSESYGFKRFMSDVEEYSLSRL